MSRRGADGLLRAVPTMAGALGMVGVLAIVVTYQFGPGLRGANNPPPPSLDVPVDRQPAITSLAASSTFAQPGQAAHSGQRAPSPDRQTVKALLLEAASRHGVNAGLVLGVAWWESGWDQSQVSPTGAVGIMQVEPYTAASAGPRLLHQQVDIHQATANVDLGTAILRANLDRYNGDLIKALVAYYAGPSAITDWAHLQPDAQRYVLGIYALAVAFDKGQGPA